MALWGSKQVVALLLFGGKSVVGEFWANDG